MTGREYTYEMAHSMSTKFGSALKRLGAKKGDCLCMVVPNIPEFPIAFFGAAGVGVTLTTMNPTYRPGNVYPQGFVESFVNFLVSKFRINSILTCLFLMLVLYKDE